MNMIETTFRQIAEGFEHNLQFEFEQRTFLAVVIESENETYIRDCYLMQDNLFPIDIPKYFGEYKGDVYTFIYDNVQRGFPLPPEEDDENFDVANEGEENEIE